MIVLLSIKQKFSNWEEFKFKYDKTFDNDYEKSLLITDLKQKDNETIGEFTWKPLSVVCSKRVKGITEVKIVSKIKNFGVRN